MRSITSFNRLLTVFLFFIGCLIAVRVSYSGSTRYLFLSWNIFLAWIPYVLSCFFKDYQHKEHWKRVFLFASWLLFFPNALYIVTDLIHLEESSSVPLWFDAVLLFASSFIGMIMAILSLHKAELFLTGMFRKRIVDLLILFILFLGSFGVYLGRFQRWNSWNVINSPLTLAADIVKRFLFPQEHLHTWAITLLLTSLYTLLYFFIKLLPQLFTENKKAPTVL